MRRQKPRAIKELAQGDLCIKHWRQDLTQSPHCSYFPYKCPRVAWGFPFASTYLPYPIQDLLFSILLSSYNSQTRNWRLVPYLHCLLSSKLQKKMNGNEDPPISSSLTTCVAKCSDIRHACTWPEGQRRWGWRWMRGKPHSGGADQQERTRQCILAQATSAKVMFHLPSIYECLEAE